MTSGMRLALAMSSALGLGLASTGASATTATSPFTVQVTIAASCTVVSGTLLNFGGSVGVLTGNLDVSTTLQVQCTNTTAYNIGLDKGANGASVTTRLMKGGPSNETIAYSLYRDSAHTLNWGVTIGTDTQAGTGTGAAQTYTVYGRIGQQNTPTPGLYIDTVTITVTY
jgi:spore coat protein U-like protein